jgi:spermidine synthase
VGRRDYRRLLRPGGIRLVQCAIGPGAAVNGGGVSGPRKKDAMKPPLDLRTVALYLAAFLTGGIVMSFEMLGSRYLNPYFGSGIYTWSALISTVLAALTTGYFCGGWLADRYPQPRILGSTIIAGSIYLILLPLFADRMLEAVLGVMEDIRIGSLLAALAIMFLPVVFLGMYSPFAVRLLLLSPAQSGSVSGAVYGISTLGSIFGTLGTTFALMPAFGSRAITIGIGVAGVITGLVLFLMAIERATWRRLVLAMAIVAAGLPISPPGESRADDAIDLRIRADALKQGNGLIAHVETEYNDVFVTKKDDYLVMSFQRHGHVNDESIVSLTNPDELPAIYSRIMMLGAIYPDELRRCLMVGLGAGSIPVYLARHLPNLVIDNVELDPGVIAASKKYFGVRETPRVHLIESDGRVFVARTKEIYDLILVDAFRGGYVPFHLLTREFYTLLKQHLSPQGVVAFHVHSGTKLSDSTLVTLKSVFPTVDLYFSGGSIISVAGNQPAMSTEMLMQRARRIQVKYSFPYPMESLLSSRIDWPGNLDAELLTDDFAPVDVYDVIKKNNVRQW